MTNSGSPRLHEASLRLTGERSCPDANGLGSSLGSSLAEDGPGRESLLVAALLAYTKWGPEGPARVRWGGYVETLPWATAEDVAFERAESFVRDAEARRADMKLMKLHGTLSESTMRVNKHLRTACSKIKRDLKRKLSWFVRLCDVLSDLS